MSKEEPGPVTEESQPKTKPDVETPPPPKPGIYRGEFLSPTNGKNPTLHTIQVLNADSDTQEIEDGLKCPIAGSKFTVGDSIVRIPHSSVAVDNGKEITYDSSTSYHWRSLTFLNRNKANGNPTGEIELEAVE